MIEPMGILDALPFWELMILVLLPLVIGLFLFFRIITAFKDILSKYRQRETTLIDDFGNLLFLIVILTVIVQVILYMVGEQPDSFSIFNFMINDMLPPTIYIILTWGVLVCLRILLEKRSSA